MGRDGLSVNRLDYVVCDRAVGLTRAVTTEESLDVGPRFVKLSLLLVREVVEQAVFLGLGQRPKGCLYLWLLKCLGVGL